MFSKLRNKLKQIHVINKLPVGVDFNPPITHTFFLIRRGILKGIYENKEFMKGKLLDFGCGSKPYKKIFEDVTSILD